MKVLFGSASTAKTLTAAFVADTNPYMLAQGYDKLQLNVTFTPGGNGEFCDLEVCTSNDTFEQVPTNWNLFADFRQPDAATPTVELVEAVPFRVPAETSAPASGTTYLRSFIIDVSGVNWVRVRAKSSAGANFGTAIVNAVLSTS
jgi:hypothetical protein